MQGTLRSVERAMQVLEELGNAPKPRSLSELSRRIGLGKATVRRFLITLEQLGYAQRTPEGYRLTDKLRSFAQRPSEFVPRAVQAELLDLSMRTQTSASLSRLEGPEVVYLWREPRGVVAGVELSEGARLPAHATAIGKVLLAQRTPQEVSETYPDARLAAYTERTITELPLLLGALQEIRRQGWALSDGELEDGLCAAAVPVYAPDGRLLCALNAAASGGRLAREAFVTEIVPQLLRSARRIGALLEDQHLRPS